MKIVKGLHENVVFSIAFLSCWGSIASRGSEPPATLLAI